MTKVSTNALQADFNIIGWKAYKNIAKKAMDKEFSWSGLIISLSIAFFIVIISSYAMSLVYQAMELSAIMDSRTRARVYYLEKPELTNFSYQQIREIYQKNIAKI